MKTNQIIPIGAIALAMLLFPSRRCEAAGMDGISYLVAVTQMKANNANEEAMQAADKHRDNAEKKKKLRAAQARLEALKKSLGGIKGDDAQAEKRVLEIDRQVTSIRKEIRSLAAASTPSPEKKRTRQTAESQR